MSLVKLKEDILAAIFSESGKLVQCELDSLSVGEDQFMSNVVFLTATVEQSDQKKIKYPLLVKFEPFNLELRKYLKTQIQFYNEVFMYSKVLPFLNRNNVCEDTFAKFYRGVGEIDCDENYLVMEDLRASGFKLTDERVYIDYEHLSLAMSKLGRFHALSYAAKQRAPEEFFKLANRLKEPSWMEDNAYTCIVSRCFHRPLEHLIERGKHVDVLRKLLNTFDRSVTEFMRKLVAPGKHSAVICHGDFNRNNILFKYDSGSGKPSDVKMFDIATARYSSPAIDIAFFLLMNSRRQTRQAHWDDLIKTYHRSLSAAVPGTEVPSLEDIRQEILQKTIYGFVHCSFFLPIMLYENRFTDLEVVMNEDEDEVAREMAQVGGEEGTNLLADMVEELVDRGMLAADHEFML